MVVEQQAWLIAIQEIGPQLGVDLPKPGRRTHAVPDSSGNHDFQQRTRVRPVAQSRSLSSANRALVGISSEVVVSRISTRERSRRVTIENEARTGIAVEVDDH